MKAIVDPQFFASYCTDASNLQGKPDQILVPESVDELCKVLRTHHENSRPVGVSGNGTGLVGGRVVSSGTLISMENFRDCEVKPAEGRARVQSGLSMREFQAAVSSEGALYPPDPTEWSAAMGGTFATNASGARTFKYGPTRSWVQAIHVVLADGEELRLHRGQCRAQNYELVLKSLSGKEYAIRLPNYRLPATSKHAAGYYTAADLDAVDLFIGSEGTLGVIVEAEVKIIEAPEHVLGMIVFFDSVENLLQAVEYLRSQKNADEIVSPRLVEFFDRHALNFISEAYPTIPSEAKAALWIEQEYTTAIEDQVFERWTGLVDSWTSLSAECWFAYDERRHAELRAFRHALPSAVYEKISANKQSKIGTDIAVPEANFRTFFNFYQELFARHGVDYVLFGHIGNCHLHANIFSNARIDYATSLRIYDECIAEGLRLGGTVSAEHGIGKLKKPYLLQMWGEEAIEQMRAVKRALDPRAILSAGNMI